MGSFGMEPAAAMDARWASPPSSPPVGDVASGGGCGGGEKSPRVSLLHLPIDGRQLRNGADGGVAVAADTRCAPMSTGGVKAVNGGDESPPGVRSLELADAPPPLVAPTLSVNAAVDAPSTASPPIPPSPATHALHLPSLTAAYGIVLVSEAARGLLLPSLYPHLLAAGGRPASLGALVAAFSVGRLAATVPLGWASDTASMRVVLAAACGLQVVGHLAYGAAVAGRAPWGLIASRVVAALVAANAVAVVALATVYRDPPRGGGGARRSPPPRTSALAAEDATPLLPAAASTPVATASDEAAPGRVAATSNGMTSPSATGGTYGATAAPRSPPPPDAVVISSLLLLNVALRSIMAALETVATPFLVNSYASLTVASAAGLLSLLGIAGLGVYASMKPLARAASDARLMAVGLTLAAAGSVPLMMGAFLPDGHLPLVATVGAMGLLWSAAYPLGQTAVLSAFAKATRGTSPGAALGLFSASGSGARVGGALAAGVAWALGGGGVVWGGVSAAAVIAMGGLARVYNRL